MFDRLKNQSNDLLRSKTRLQKDLSEAKAIAKNSENNTGPLVSFETTKEEFIERYKNARILSYILLFFIIGIFAIMFLFVKDIVSLIVCLLTLSIFVMSYGKNAFRLWCAREVYKKWDDRFSTRTIKINEYLNAVWLDYKKLFPLDINS